MLRVDPALAEQIDRLLVFLSIAGGAALVSKRRRAVLAVRGDVDAELALASLDVAPDALERVMHTSGGLVADVRQDYRVFVSLGVCSVPDPQMLLRVRHAQDLMERVLTPASPGALPPLGGTSAPPSSTPAHAVVFAPTRRS